MNTCDHEADRWLDVLAGRRSPQDADTRQAAALRDALLEMHRSNDPLDEDTVNRMLATMRSRGAFDATSTPQRVRSRQSLVGQLLHGIRTGMLSATWSVAILTAVITSTATSWLLDRCMGPDDDADRLRPGPTHASVIRTANPRGEALELAATLSRLGAMPRVEFLSPQWRVHAQLPMESLEAYQVALGDLGLVVPPSGQLSVRFIR